jgi:hypothetical protein
MKRAGRYLLSGAAILSLLLAVGFSIVWASRLLPRPWQIHLSLHLRANSTRSFEIFDGSNYIYFEQLKYEENPIEGPPVLDFSATKAFQSQFADQMADDDYRSLAVNHKRRPIFGTTSRGQILWAGSLSAFGIGFGYFPLLFLLLPMIRLRAAIRWAKQRYSRKPGQCHKCGYDVRASSDRCPECGTPIAVSGNIWM